MGDDNRREEMETEGQPRDGWRGKSLVGMMKALDEYAEIYRAL